MDLDPDALIPGADAARLARTRIANICVWVNREILLVAEERNGRRYYRVRDVLAAERQTRRTVRTHGGRRRAVHAA